MYDPKQRERANRLQKELSEGRKAKEAFDLLSTYMSNACRVFGYRTKEISPEGILKELVEEVIKLREEAKETSEKYCLAMKDTGDALVKYKHECDRLNKKVAAQNDLIVAYHVDSPELIADAMKRIE